MKPVFSLILCWNSDFSDHYSIGKRLRFLKNIMLLYVRGPYAWYKMNYIKYGGYFLCMPHIGLGGGSGETGPLKLMSYTDIWAAKVSLDIRTSMCSYIEIYYTLAFRVFPKFINSLKLFWEYQWISLSQLLCLLLIKQKSCED